MQLRGSTVLKTSSDVVRLQFPGEDGPIFVLQLGDADQNVVIREGGPMVFALLDLCDGEHSLDSVSRSLQDEFCGHDTLWSRELPDAITTLLSWRVLEVLR